MKMLSVTVYDTISKYYDGEFTGGMKGLGNVLYYAMPIIMTGLGIGFAFQMSIFNIGGSGQFFVWIS